MVTRSTEHQQDREEDSPQATELGSKLNEQTAENSILSKENDELRSLLQSCLGHLDTLSGMSNKGADKIDQTANIALSQLERFVFIPGSAIERAATAVYDARRLARQMRDHVEEGKIHVREVISSATNVANASSSLRDCLPV